MNSLFLCIAIAFAFFMHWVLLLRWTSRELIIHFNTGRNAISFQGFWNVYKYGLMVVLLSAVCQIALLGICIFYIASYFSFDLIGYICCASLIGMYAKARIYYAVAVYTVLRTVFQNGMPKQMNMRNFKE